MQQDYTYAVARIRFRETQLLTDADLSQMLAGPDVESVLRRLRDKGWDDCSDGDTEALLSAETEKLWSFVGESVEDMSTFDFLRVPDDFHNLKVAIKCVTRDIKPDGMFLYDSVEKPETIYDCVAKREYDRLPEYLREAAKNAMTAILQTSDGQLCDIIVDKACMEYVGSLGRRSDDAFIRMYCELFIASSDIRIAVRSQRTGKKPEFIRRAMADCDTLDIEKLAFAASVGYDEIISYLAQTDYRSAVEAVNTSMSAFEKWCDDHLTSAMKSQKWEPFGIGPIVAYIIARQNEIKAVRMILAAKQNGLPEGIIKERLRMMYV